MKWNYKLLYLLTLGALCLYVTTGPAEALVPVSGPQITNTGVGTGTSTGLGLLNWTNIGWEESLPYTTADLYADADCPPGDGSCAGTLGFDFKVGGAGAITIVLIGTSNDPGAAGTVTFYGTTQTWSVSGGDLSMTPFTVQVPDSLAAYSGEFTITSLASGGYVELPVEFDSGPSSVPEPSSALLLGAGFAFVEFLRRKSRR